MLFCPTSHGEEGAASSPVRALPHSEVLGQAETLLSSWWGTGLCTVCCHCCPSPGGGHQALPRAAAQGWGRRGGRVAALSPHPSAVSTVLCLAVACPGVLSLSFPLQQQGSHLEGQATDLATAGAPALLLATGQVLLCALLQLWALSSLPIAQPLLFTLFSRDEFCCCSGRENH